MINVNEAQFILKYHAISTFFNASPQGEKSSEENHWDPPISLRVSSLAHRPLVLAPTSISSIIFSLQSETTQETGQGEPKRLPKFRVNLRRS